MRLIDADELIKTYEKETGYTWGAKGILECPKMFIDNAPTVESDITNDDLQACMAESYHLGYELAETKFKRPQGEWIKKVDNVGFISHICSECGAEIEVEDPCDDKFCFNCGAKMEMTKNGRE